MSSPQVAGDSLARPGTAIPERLGFTREGTLREAQFVKGRYLDLAVYNMLAAE